MVLAPILRMERRASSRSAAIKTLLRNPRILNFNLLTVWITSGGKKGEEGEKNRKFSAFSILGPPWRVHEVCTWWFFLMYGQDIRDDYQIVMQKTNLWSHGHISTDLKLAAESESKRKFAWLIFLSTSG